MALKLGSTDVSKVYRGTVEVDKIYLGTTQIYTAQQAQLSGAQKTAIDAIVASSMTTYPGQSPGCIIDITGPLGTYTKAYGGNTHPYTTVPITSDSQFRIGSVSKMFTGMAFWMAVDDGLIELTDVLETYVPGFQRGSSITMAHLMSHRSGVYDFTYDQAILARILSTPTAPYSRDEAIALSKSRPSGFVPGSQYQYANTNALLIDACLEAATGRKLRNIITEDIITPLGLSKTFWPTNTTVPYPNTDNVAQLNPDIFGAAGCMISNAQNLTKWISAVRDGLLISPESHALWLGTFPTTGIANTMGATPPATTSSGYFMLQYGSWQGHEGTVVNSGTACVWDTETGATIICHQNIPGWLTGGVEFYRTMRNIANYLYPDSLT